VAETGLPSNGTAVHGSIGRLVPEARASLRRDVGGGFRGASGTDLEVVSGAVREAISGVQPCPG